jgi:hypothetical protein
VSDKAPTIEDLQTSVTKLETTLAKVRDEAKAEKAATLAPFRKALGLPDDAGADLILDAMTKRAPDAEALIAERTKVIAAERDAAVATAGQVRAERAAERIDVAITAALGKSGMIPENGEDAANLLRPLLTVDPKTGSVVTKEAPGVIPGQSADQYIHAQLKTARPHWWSRSIGGKATGGTRASSGGGDTSVFDPLSPKFSLTAQAQFERRFGVEAARRAALAHGQRLAGEGRR